MTKHFHDEKDALPLTAQPTHRIIVIMITSSCAAAVMKKATLVGASDRRAR
jgi:hypothetical protein